MDDARQADGAARPDVKFRSADNRRYGSCRQKNKTQDIVQSEMNNFRLYLRHIWLLINLHWAHVARH